MPVIAQSSKRAAPGRPFKKGQSGNPGGRPKGLAARVRALAPEAEVAEWKWAIWTLHVPTLKRLKIPIEEITLEERNKAHDWLADRGYGKAPTYAPVVGEDPLELTAIDAAIVGGLDELAERREAAPAGGDPAAPLEATG